MASSSSAIISSSQHPQWNYDVFLSFRGEDTRKTFTSHLYEGLNRMGIVTFQDDKRLEHGTSISMELCKAIEESQFAIIVFSNNYASSGWCLDELAKIMKCREEYGQTVVPVFYDVDPSTIRHQKGSFGEAFAKHESRYKDDDEGMQKVQGWKTALTEAANLSGHDIRNRTEAECIQQIVDQIFKYCKGIPSSSQDVVGIKTHLRTLKSLLEVETNDIRIVGICGMGGVGKTTIAREVFSDLFHQFNATCFLADVKEKAEKHGMHSLQNTLLSDLLKKKSEYVDDKEAGKVMMASSCSRKKVLIVLDDINHKDHMEYLAGDLGWFGKGSRVIVTTRDKRLIDKGNALYEVHTLPDHEAMQVFSRHAFKKEVPDQGFEELSWKVVNHAKGLPLALKVWGASLHNRDINQWKHFIEQMKKCVGSEIVEKLKISYDDLEPIQQQMFLDIACFFRGDRKGFVKRILESCFGANIGLTVLIEKNLVFYDFHRIEMHDLIQEMGKNIVNVHKKPGKRSRLWLTKDIENVMMNNTGTDAIGAIKIMSPSNLQISEKALEPMEELRMLLVQDGGNEYEDVRISFHDDTFKYLSNNLSCFVWNDYRGKSLPPNFEPKELVHLELSNSKLRHLWNGRKDFRYLRRLNLSRSSRLIETPDFSGMPNLEYLDLRYCGDLKEVHPSLGLYCTKLIRLDLIWCVSLKRFPCVNVESLEYLRLKYCSSLVKFPEIIGSMKSELEIDMKDFGIRELPSSFFQYHTAKLNLCGLENLVSLPNTICKSKSLKFLDVSKCSKLESLPEEIGDLENLEELYAGDTLISRPLPSIVHLNKLKILSFYKEESKEGHFVFPRVNEGLRSLEELNLTNCNLIDGGLPEDIGCLSSLKKLYLAKNDCGHLPRSIAQLGALEVLDLSCCKKLRALPELPPNLESLNLSNCFALKEVHHSVGNCSKLIKLDLFECIRLERFPCVNVDSLKYLSLKGCRSLEKFPEIIGSMKSELEIHMKDSGIRELPSSLFQGPQLGALRVLDVSFCKRLRKVPELLPNVLELKADSYVGPSIQNYLNVELLRFTEVEFDDSIGDLFAQILSLRKAFSASDSLSQRVFKMLWHSPTKIPNWLRYDATPRTLLLVKLPESWYANGKFLGFVICYYGSSDEIVVELIPSPNDDEPEKLSKRLAVPPMRETMGKNGVSFDFIPLASLWDTSKAKGKTPDGYGHLRFSLIYKAALEFGFCLLYKDDPEREALLEKLEHNHNHKRKFGEHHDSMTNEEEGPSTSGLLHLFPENPGS